MGMYPDIFLWKFINVYFLQKCDHTMYFKTYFKLAVSHEYTSMSEQI